MFFKVAAAFSISFLGVFLVTIVLPFCVFGALFGLNSSAFSVCFWLRNLPGSGRLGGRLWELPEVYSFLYEGAYLRTRLVIFLVFGP